jgi:peptide/nickel transport system ATP-binding protein
VEFATRIAVMYAGEIVEMAPAREMLALPLHPYTQGLMNSFPSINGERKKLTGIPGAPPDLLNLPHGCRFQPRCPLAKPICGQTTPTLRLVGKDHQAACHLY